MFQSSPGKNSQLLLWFRDFDTLDNLTEFVVEGVGLWLVPTGTRHESGKFYGRSFED